MSIPISFFCHYLLQKLLTIIILIVLFLNVYSNFILLSLFVTKITGFAFTTTTCMHVAIASISDTYPFCTDFAHQNNTQRMPKKKIILSWSKSQTLLLYISYLLSLFHVHRNSNDLVKVL